MRKGKHAKQKYRIIEAYSILILIATLFMSVGYAQISETKLEISGELVSTAQDGVFITDVTYMKNEGADTTNSKINYFLGTMLESEIALGNTASSTMTYQVTVYNKTDKEMLFIDVITDKTDLDLYSNDNIEYSLETVDELVGIEKYVTTIAPNSSITFPVTFKYKAGADTTQNILSSKLNFRFMEKPIINLSNEEQTYRLEDINPEDASIEYEFTVTNYTENEINTVPMEYYFETVSDTPLTVKIYNDQDEEVTKKINLTSDGTTKETVTYKAKIIWNDSSSEYDGKEYNSTITLKAEPTNEKYENCVIEKEFYVKLAICNHNFELHEGAGKKYLTTSIYTDPKGKTAVIPEGFTVSGVGGTCTICGKVSSITENTVDEGLVIYLIDDKESSEIADIKWSDDATMETLRNSYDQFVWIPIKTQDINDMYICKGKTGDNGNCVIKVVDGIAECQTEAHKILDTDGTTYKNTLMAGRLYATDVGDVFEDNFTDIFENSTTKLREPDVISNDSNSTNLSYLSSILEPDIEEAKREYNSKDKFKAKLQEEYNEVVKSVYENQGFYVGRYETSNVTTEAGTAIQIQAGKTPTSLINWYYMYAQQKSYARNKNLNVGSTMIQGAAYDQVMKFVNTDKFNVKIAGQVEQNFQTKYNTGSQITDQSKNIFDLEGNVQAWTTEAGTYAFHRIYRGRMF